MVGRLRLTAICIDQRHCNTKRTKDTKGAKPVGAWRVRPGDESASREAQIPFLVFFFVSFVRFVSKSLFPKPQQFEPRFTSQAGAAALNPIRASSRQS